ncbi:MAG: bifunctional UDP-N-acetylglucosamine pyrophosphorylase / glucosamine-phosphate N-acetyltransferase, partial [Gaiellaceae bacterium]|nr:bifunctional UDP-N-acetylglucosamine pyrophosphorylase / glucosamine-phosphate N-acetyltransferase [Gaiellaceae bacterium]
VVASPDTRDLFDGVTVAVQETPRGTGDAVRSARAALDGFDGDVLVLNGDVPALSAEVLDGLLAEHRNANATATVLSFQPPDPRAYGRIIRKGDGLARIVEAGDATADELAVREVNSGIYVFRADKLWGALERLQPHNAQGELYVTDTIGFLVADGEPVAVHLAPDPVEAEGINTRVELAEAAAVLRDRINHAHMLAGVTIVDPSSTWIDYAVELEPDTTIHPFTVLRGSTKVASGVEIHPHVVAIDTQNGAYATVGPFCYLRPGTVLEARAKAGTFVELKNSHIGEGTKVPHLSYLGDADVGADTNIAAGAITVNFPHHVGRDKGRTTIGSNVRTGVQNAFFAPVEFGDDAWVGAGSVITDDVPPGALAIARAKQVNKEGYADEHRND